MDTSKDQGPIKLCGTPRRLELMSPLTLGDGCIELTSDALSQDRASKRLQCRLKRFTPGNPVSMRLKLPQDTPPGVYQAKLMADGEPRAVEIEVQPHSKLKHVPSSLQLQGAPGAKVSQVMVFENRGNVPIIIPDQAIGNLFRAAAIPEALTATLQLEAANSQAMLDSLLGKLQQGYGGVMKFHFAADEMTLQPNDRRAFTVSSRLPAQVQAGQRYMGWLHLNEFHVMMQVVVSA